MYKLFIANKNYSSWSLRPWLLMKALSIPFEEILVPFTGESSATEFATFSANGKVPCLHDKQIKVWDSLAICEYLAEAYPQVWPRDKVARAWARSVVAEMHSGFSDLRNVCGMNIGVRVKLDQLSPELLKDIQRIDDIWCEGLTRFNGPYLTGTTFTAADAFYAPIAFRFRGYNLPLSDAANRYCERLLKSDAMQLWETEALKEVWRDALHEKEVTAFGQIIEDKRTSLTP